MCRMVVAPSGRQRCGPHRSVAAMFDSRTAWDKGTPGDTIPTSAQLRVERVQDVRVQRTDLDLAEEGRDVVADVATVERQRGGSAVELVEVALQQLVHRGVASRVPSLFDLTDQPVVDPRCLSASLGSRRNDLDQVMPALAHRIDSGIDPDPQRPTREPVDAALGTSRGIGPGDRVTERRPTRIVSRRAFVIHTGTYLPSQAHAETEIGDAAAPRHRLRASLTRSQSTIHPGPSWTRRPAHH